MKRIKFPPASSIALFLLLAVALVACNDDDGPSVQVDPKPLSTPDQPTLTSSSTEDQPNITFRCLDQRVPVIMYHDIVDRRTKNTVWFDCTGREFAAQMRQIKHDGYQPVSLDDLYKHLTDGKPLPPKAIVLTFDDNYQGYYDLAWPILKREKYPSAMFVHTGYVGTTTGRAHMTWDTLASLSKTSLVTIGSHTVSHPDLTTLTPTEVDKELRDAKDDLEKHLGTSVDYFAYPDGKNDASVQDASRAAGYKMAFSIENGPAEESPNIQCVNRYIQTRLQLALDQCQQAQDGSVGVYTGPIKSGPVAFKEFEQDRQKLVIVSGGKPESVVSETREGVLDFVHRKTAVAGINGTFFDMAAIESTDNKLVGPCKTADTPELLPDIEPNRWIKIRNRPLIMWGPTQSAIVPYDPPLMNDPKAYKAFMPDMTDAFLGGAWLIHKGQPRTGEQLLICGSQDVEDPRRRAAFGFMADGTPFAAASKSSVRSSEFAELLSAAGAQEAVLLDSGFSTSLVYGEKIMASGHSTDTEASRPVPHAIVFMGDLDPASEAAADAEVPATTSGVTTVVHRRLHRRRRRRHVTVAQ